MGALRYKSLSIGAAEFKFCLCSLVLKDSEVLSAKLFGSVAIVSCFRIVFFHCAFCVFAGSLFGCISCPYFEKLIIKLFTILIECLLKLTD